MKKLKIKVFLSIFIILTIFSSGLIFAYNLRNYNNEVKRIDGLLRNNNIFVRRNNTMRFMDNDIYTVFYDSNGSFDIISYADDDDIPEELVNFVKTMDVSNKKMVIGNLYNSKYSYNIRRNYIVIVDTSNAAYRLNGILKESLFLLIIIEIIVYIISYYLSKWIIKPAVDAFDSQKQFIADASHELKTPLAVIMASADALKEDNIESKWIDNIQYEADRMNNLIKNLLDLSRLESVNTQRENIDLSKLFAKSILSLESLVFEKNIDLKYSIEEKIMFYSNSDEMKQLISILLDNAIKHSVSNGKIIINLKENKNNIVLEVKNKGTAIKKGDEEKIFDRFYRADESRNRSENRYGLGLAIAKAICEKNSGVITASSGGGYTTFKVVFKKK